VPKPSKLLPLPFEAPTEDIGTGLHFLLLVTIWFAILAQKNIPNMAIVAKETMSSFSIIRDCANLQ
jgi:hypothetical protein